MRHRKALIVTGSIVGVVGLVLLAAQDPETLRVTSPVAARDARFIDYAASLVGARVTRGDSYRLLRNGDEIFPAMVGAVDAARQRVALESFIYSQGVVSDRMTHALGRAAERGVTVRLVLDTYGAFDMPSASRDRLARAGARLAWFNPVRPWTLKRTNYRTHRKILVVDGEVGFTGGAGFADHWLGHAEDPQHWRDMQVEVRGPAVRLLEAAFYENWLESGGLEAPVLDAAPEERDTGARSLVIWSNPVGGASNVKLLYLMAIAGARVRIDIESPYFVLDESTRFVLDEARRRGVRVRVLTDGDHTDGKPVKYASRAAYESLLAAGYEIHEYAPTMLHVKAMVVDGTFSLFGSANFDNRSFELNDELTIGVADPDVAQALTAGFEADLQRAHRLDPREWRERSVLERSRETFWSAFGEMF